MTYHPKIGEHVYVRPLGRIEQVVGWHRGSYRLGCGALATAAEMEPLPLRSAAFGDLPE